MCDGIYRDIRSAGSTDEASGHTHTVQQYNQHKDALYRKEDLLKSTIVTSPSCSCFLVCLSVAFKILNHVKGCYKPDVNIMMTLGGTATH
jgi:hypothetical protein